MSSRFWPFRTAVLAVALVSIDGESNWFEGLQLLGVYFIFAIAFYLIPAK